MQKQKTYIFTTLAVFIGVFLFVFGIAVTPVRADEIPAISNIRVSGPGVHMTQPGDENGLDAVYFVQRGTPVSYTWNASGAVRYRWLARAHQAPRWTNLGAEQRVESGTVLVPAGIYKTRILACSRPTGFDGANPDNCPSGFFAIGDVHLIVGEGGSGSGVSPDETATPVTLINLRVNIIEAGQSPRAAATNENGEYIVPLGSQLSYNWTAQNAVRYRWYAPAHGVSDWENLDISGGVQGVITSRATQAGSGTVRILACGTPVGVGATLSDPDNCPSRTAQSDKNFEIANIPVTIVSTPSGELAEPEPVPPTVSIEPGIVGMREEAVFSWSAAQNADCELYVNGLGTDEVLMGNIPCEEGSSETFSGFDLSRGNPGLYFGRIRACNSRNVCRDSNEVRLEVKEFVVSPQKPVINVSVSEIRPDRTAIVSWGRVQNGATCVLNVGSESNELPSCEGDTFSFTGLGLAEAHNVAANLEFGPQTFNAQLCARNDRGEACSDTKTITVLPFSDVSATSSEPLIQDFRVVNRFGRRVSESNPAIAGRRITYRWHIARPGDIVRYRGRIESGPGIRSGDYDWIDLNFSRRQDSFTVRIPQNITLTKGNSYVIALMACSRSDCSAGSREIHRTRYEIASLDLIRELRVVDENDMLIARKGPASPDRPVSPEQTITYRWFHAQDASRVRGYRARVQSGPETTSWLDLNISGTRTSFETAAPKKPGNYNIELLACTLPNDDDKRCPGGEYDIEEVEFRVEEDSGVRFEEGVFYALFSIISRPFATIFEPRR